METSNEIIEIAPSGEVTFASNVNAFLKALNPLGVISETVGKIIACRVKIKELKVEAEEIKLEYETRKKMVDGALSYAQQQIEMQKQGMEKFFRHAEKQLELSRLYSTERMKVMREMTALMRDPTASISEKRLAQEAIMAMSTDLLESTKAGSTILSKLVESSNQNLLSIPSLTGLLPPGKNK